MRNVKIWSAILLLVFVLLPPHGEALALQVASNMTQSNANDLIAAVNALRVANGLPPYTVNSILMQVAQDQVNYMAATGQVVHRPGLTERILAAGYPLAGDLSQGGFRAENITGGNITSEQAVQEWTRDVLHTNTMLSPNLTEIGAGVVKVGDRYYMVIDCAAPTTGGVPQAFTPNAAGATIESFSPSDFIIPVTTNTPDESGLVFHEVQYGQTLWTIAIGYGVKIDEIRALNNLGVRTDIYPGDRLLVKKVAPPAGVTATLEASIVLTETIEIITPTNLPTQILFVTESPATVIAIQEESVGNNSIAGIVVGNVLVALMFAGMLTWIGSRRTD
jgi:LysM repeat protein